MPVFRIAIDIHLVCLSSLEDRDLMPCQEPPVWTPISRMGMRLRVDYFVRRV